MKDKWRLKTQTAENTKLRGPLSAFAMRKVFFPFLYSLQLSIANPIFHLSIMNVKVLYLFFSSFFVLFLYVFCVVHPKSLSDVTKFCNLKIVVLK